MSSDLFGGQDHTHSIMQVGLNKSTVVMVLNMNLLPSHTIQSTHQPGSRSILYQGHPPAMLEEKDERPCYDEPNPTVAWLEAKALQEAKVANAKAAE